MHLLKRVQKHSKAHDKAQTLALTLFMNLPQDTTQRALELTRRKARIISTLYPEVSFREAQTLTKELAQHDGSRSGFDDNSKLMPGMTPSVFYQTLANQDGRTIVVTLVEQIIANHHASKNKPDHVSGKERTPISRQETSTTSSRWVPPRGYKKVVPLGMSGAWEAELQSCKRELQAAKAFVQSVGNLEEANQALDAYTELFDQN